MQLSSLTSNEKDTEFHIVIKKTTHIEFKHQNSDLRTLKDG